MSSLKSVFAVVGCFCLGAAFIDEVRAEPAAPAAVVLNLPAQAMERSLAELSQKTGLGMIFATEAVAKDLQAPAIQGTYAPEEALRKLLANSGLQYSFVNERTVAIRGASPTAGAFEPEGTSIRLAQAENAFESDASRQGRAEQAQSMEVSGGDKDVVGLEEVIVTAQRREQSLQDVPISIAVLSGEALDQSTGEGVLDALNRVAGVVVTQQGNTGSVITIRGVGPAYPSFFDASPVGYYLDSVPFGFIKAAFVPNMSAYDLERVEVLRGPQGTLYGASSVGGLVRVLSKDADLDSTEFKFRSSLSETRHGGLNYGVDAAVNVPIVEGVVAARVVAGYQDLSGWIDQPNAGRNDANDGLNKTLRFKLNAKPTDALSLEFSTWFSRNEDGALSQANDARQYLTVIDEPLTSDFDLYAFDLGYDFGAFSLNSATSYMSYEFAAVSGNNFLPRTYFTNRQLADVFSQEFQLASTTEGPWRWAAGAIYREVEERIFQFATDQSGAPTQGFVQPEDISLFSESYAAYGELTRIFFDGRFELTGGLRYFHDEVHQREDSNAAGPPAGESRTRAFEKVSPRLVLSWLPIEHFTGYVSYSEGYRSGVDQYANVAVAYPDLPDAEPDNLRNYEMGFKGDVLDGQLSFDVAVYYMDWQDVQAPTLALVIPPTGYSAAVLNGSSASGPGIDLSLVARPTDRLSLGINVGWNDLTFDESVKIASAGPLGTIVTYQKGDRLSLSPEYTGGVWLDYTVPVSADGHDLRFSASGNYYSERYQRLFGQPGAAFQNEPLTTVAARVTLETPDNWSLALFAENLTDEQTPITGLDPTGRTDTATRMRPRTVGVQFEYSFGRQ